MTDTTEERAATAASAEVEEIIVFEMRIAIPGLPEPFREQFTLTLRVGRTEPQDGRGYFIDTLKGAETRDETRGWHPLDEGDTDELAAINGLHSVSEGLAQAADFYLSMLALREMPVSHLTDALREMRQSGVLTEMKPVTGDKQKLFTGVNHAESN